MIGIRFSFADKHGFGEAAQLRPASRRRVHKGSNTMSKQRRRKSLLDISAEDVDRQLAAPRRKRQRDLSAISAEDVDREMATAPDKPMDLGKAHGGKTKRRADRR